MFRLGIDAGAFSVQIAVLSEDRKIIYKAECPHNKKVKETTVKMLQDAAAQIGSEDVKICACGSMSHLLNLSETAVISDQAAISYALTEYVPAAASAIVIGAQKTMYLSKPDGIHYEIRKNSNCSAGTGAFFEEQASRLQLKLEDISDVVSDAASIPDIAGRCSVFSKTDMIHRMQEGIPTADILLGLCYALVRNYRSSILRNQKPQLPVYLAGGVMKNKGVLCALKDLLELAEKECIIDDNLAFLGALGAAVKAEECGIVTGLDGLISKVSEKTLIQDDSGLMPLAGFCTDQDSPEFKTVPYVKGEKTYLGIDVGSTSINLVLINEKQEVIYFSYVKTLGKPLDIVRTEIDKMRKAIPGLEGYRTAVTGSGREFIGREIGADLVINEITAQTEGALLSHPETDTVFEIGGQDSKYMSCRNARMTDFEMNKVCAAGTGAFLEEQIHKLGISMAEFTEYALRAEHPCQLGNRCTVFIEGSINQALAFGYSMEDVCAGLAYAIVSNYLFRVVNRKPIGSTIAIQGGIAYNRAVVCAFRAITGKEIHVSPYFSVTGALGCASLLIHHSQLAFDAEKNRRLNQLLLERSEESYLKDYKKPSFDGKKKVVVIPRVVFLHKMFPLFNALFTNLGFEVMISPLSDTAIVKKAQQYCTAETCFPIKLIYGHIAWLLEQNVDIIVLPRLYTIKHEGSVARKDYACMYMQTSPLLMEQAFHFKERGVQLIMPELSLQPQEAVGADKITYGTGGCSGCTSCADQGKQIDLTHFDRVLIPDYGIYSDIIEKYVRKEISETNAAAATLIERVHPLTAHKTFDYAMNKEYYSMLIMLEELRNTVQKGISYVMAAPIDEGSEVFGQYALLCTQELKRLGFNVTLRPFYMEDLIRRDNYIDIYQDMLDAEMNQLTARELKPGAKNLFAMGEPMCICKPYIRDRNLKAAADHNTAFMPMSEVLLFHMLEIDRKREHAQRLEKWQEMHDKAMKSSMGRRLYSPMEKLRSAADGKLDFCIGDGGKYRFAKLLSLTENEADAAVLLNSSEENTAIILKQLMSGCRSDISVPFIQLDLDYEHTAGKEDFELL